VTHEEILISHDDLLDQQKCTNNFYPAPDSVGDRVLFSIDFFVCLFVYFFLSLLFLCQKDYEKRAGLICMKFSGKVWSDHGMT